MMALYVVLAIGATGCFLVPSEQASPLHHHSKSHVAHSAFCAWACQANPTISALSVAPPAAVLELVAVLLLIGTVLQSKDYAVISRSRAPPR
jgi:hypothetical protein